VLPPKLFPKGRDMLSPIPIERFAASAQGPASSEFFPHEAYNSPGFHDFELAAIWHKEWIAVGRAEEMPRVGDYFSVTIGREPILVVRASATEIVAMSPICRHRGMLVAEGSGNCRGAFVCPYHGWSYDLQGKLRGAPQMAGRADFDRSRVSLPRVRVELWQGIVFVNFDQNAAPLAPRLKSLEPLVRDWHLEDLRGEFQRDPNYRMQFEHPWNWKVYSEGQSECYHCDKLHGTTPIMSNIDFGSMSMEVEDTDAGVWAFGLRSRVQDPTINQHGRAILPPIPTLSGEQRFMTYAITIAPNVFMALMADSVIILNWMPLGPQSMKVKRHRLYPQSTLALPEFDEVHRTESPATREFVGQDEYAFERVQAGLNSMFAPRGPIAPKEPVLVGFNHWLVDRYRRTDAAARSTAAAAEPA
jgi:phenylpropionate dioxygenase-like ring-hydroxylating dioxygenase large terminal subunit